MKKHLNILNTVAEYQEYSASTAYSKPNVTYVRENKVLYYDYGDNKPQVDMSNYKGEFQESSVGVDKYGKDAITKINYIPSRVTSLDYAFQNFSSLEEVTCELPSGVTSMYCTFNGCKSIVNVLEIPTGVKDMSSTFKYCSSLVNGPSVIPNSVTKMGNTFYGCKRLLTAPEMPNSITSMDATFTSCESLITAPSVIPDSVTNMSQTFFGCSSLVTAPNIPSSVTNLEHTFRMCSSLKEATFLHTTPPTYNSTLSYCSSLESIYVPDEAVDAFKTATGWSEFASKFKPLSEKPSE